MKKITLKDRVIERLDMYSLEGPFQGKRETEQCADDLIGMITREIKKAVAQAAK